LTGCQDAQSAPPGHRPYRPEAKVSKVIRTGMMELWNNVKEEDRSQKTGDRINDKIQKPKFESQGESFITKARNSKSTKKYISRRDAEAAESSF
jgi:hypothetical protein